VSLHSRAGIFFPSDGRCETYKKKKECLATPSKIIAGSKTCTWTVLTDGTQGCKATPPPGGIIFLIVICILIMVLAVPLVFGIEYFQDIAAARPNLDKLIPGFNMNSWFGTVYIRSDRYKSALVLAMHETFLMQREIAKAAGDGEAHDVANYEDLEMSAAIGALSQAEIDAIAQGVYHEFASPEEEMMRLMYRVKASIERRYHQASTPAWLATTSARTSKVTIASVRAVEDLLFVNPDGTMKPLTIRQRLFMGTLESYLVRRIEAARKGAEKIREELKELEVSPLFIKTSWWWVACHESLAIVLT